MKKLLGVTGLVFLASVGSAFAAMDDGGWSGGGGDPVRIYFEEGRQRAAEMLRRIERRSFGEDVEAATIEWILERREAMAADVMESPYEWFSSARPTCARTSFARNAAVELSSVSCRSISSAPEAAKLILHETVHHFGVEDEEFADRVALSVAAAWENLKLREVPICDNSENDNVYVERLFGNWILDRELTERLYGEQYPYLGEMHFERDLGAAKLLPGIGKCAWTAGYWDVDPADPDRKSYRSPFIVIELNGNPAIVWDEDCATPAGCGSAEDGMDLHPNYSMLARAKDSANDILFIGGDNAEPHAAFVRKN